MGNAEFHSSQVQGAYQARGESLVIIWFGAVDNDDFFELLFQERQQSPIIHVTTVAEVEKWRRYWADVYDLNQEAHEPHVIYIDHTPPAEQNTDHVMIFIALMVLQ